MTYVFVTYIYLPGFDSPENWYKRTDIYSGVLEHLARNNTVINVIQINYKGNCIYNGVQYRFVNFHKRRRYFAGRLNRYVRDLDPDIVFVQGLHHPLQVIQLRLLLNKRVKIMAQHHAEQPFTGIKKYAQRMADPCIDAYLFASYALGQHWVNKGNLSSLHKIHEVMEVSSRFHPIEKWLARSGTATLGNPVFLWVGRLNANKDPLNVIKAFLKFVQIAPSARLYMIFHTTELMAGITDLLKDHPQKNALLLIGKVVHAELLYWFNSADFIISGSHYEGSGTAVCEAMSCGCVPVVTDIFSFRMITDNGRCGILYEAGNETALLKALVQTQQTEAEEMRSRCLAYFRSNLSFEAIAARIHDIAGSL